MVLNKLKIILIENSYPLPLINKLLFSSSSRDTPLVTPTIPNHINNSMNNFNSDNNITFSSLNYFEELTPKLISIFKHENVKIAKKNVITVNKLYSRTKTPIKKMDKSDVIYSIPCSECNGIYIGQTSRNLKGRITTHKSDCRIRKNSCALSEHHITTSHALNFNETKILDGERNYFKRVFLEMFHINKNQNTMNKKSDIKDLSNIYSFLFQLAAKL